MNRVEWSTVAEDDYLALLEQTYMHSTEGGVALFERMESLLENLRQFKHFCPPTEKFPKFRRCVVTRHLSLVYEVGEHSITIMSIFDPRGSNPFV
jgi:plasmid stabilization system protein ParE